MATSRKKRVASSEYGGDDGLLQPYPHELTPQERSLVMRSRAAGDGQGGTRGVGGGAPPRADVEGWPDVISERLD
jgi:hypothetical protein